MKYLLFSFPFLLLFSCVQDKVERPDADNSKEYFPLISGRYIDYQVDSIVFDDAPGGNRKDTVTFQLREETGDFYLSPLGDTIYLIYRYRRTDVADNWVLTDVWTARYLENNALRTEENLTFRKMTFPLRSGLRWIATSYIPALTSVMIGTENIEMYEYWESRVLEVDVAAEAGVFSFPEGTALQVSQTDTDDGAMKRFVRETYVRDIGLVARTDSILDSRCIQIGDFGPCFGKAWTEHAGKGYILSQTIIGHN